VNNANGREHEVDNDHEPIPMVYGIVQTVGPSCNARQRDDQEDFYQKIEMEGPDIRGVSKTGGLC
jgi:hypothetical protein